MSSDSIRPGGLTALAIFNFIFGGLGALSLLGLVMMLSMVSTERMPKGADAPDFRSLAIVVAIGGVGTLLLLVSGVGYLLQRRILGRVLGSAYAVVALTNAILTTVLISKDVGMMNLVGFIYPVVTIVLINTTFRHDFVNP